MGVEAKMADAADVFKSALSLDTQLRAALAQRLLDSLEELSEEEAERLWAEEAQRRLEGYLGAGARVVSAAAVAAKAERLLR